MGKTLRKKLSYALVAIFCAASLCSTWLALATEARLYWVLLVACIGVAALALAALISPTGGLRPYTPKIDPDKSTAPIDSRH